ncbi:hypothetical protein Ocin01_07026 [Orchesella cincta]|uniref:Uncharacterized protein n=1 Tax=Orchesella cincta TaxID=48709 RepID=A0A1D2N3L5_ORCCI|nr:hypothetical protein Ocin01_07026 [Orchesella cincta]
MVAFFKSVLIVGIAFSVGVTTERCPNYKDFLELGRTRPVAKLLSTNVCYWSFDQGPCNPGEWFRFGDDVKTVNSTRPGHCEKRFCRENSEEDRDAAYPRFWFEHKGECLLTDVENVKFCGNNTTKVYFTEDDNEPTCRETQPLVLSQRGLFRNLFKKVRGF